MSRPHTTPALIKSLAKNGTVLESWCWFRDEKGHLSNQFPPGDYNTWPNWIICSWHVKIPRYTIPAATIARTIIRKHGEVDDMPHSLPEMRKHDSYVSMHTPVVKVRNPLETGGVGMHDNVDPNYFIDKARRLGIPYWSKWMRVNRKNRVGSEHRKRKKCVWCARRIKESCMKRMDFASRKRWGKHNVQWSHEHCLFLSEL